MRHLCWLLAAVCVSIPGQTLAQGNWDTPYDTAYLYRRDVLSRIRGERMRNRSGLLLSGRPGRDAFDPFGYVPFYGPVPRLRPDAAAAAADLCDGSADTAGARFANG